MASGADLVEFFCCIGPSEDLLAPGWSLHPVVLHCYPKTPAFAVETLVAFCFPKKGPCVVTREAPEPLSFEFLLTESDGRRLVACALVVGVKLAAERWAPRAHVVVSR